jgi:hypothetical protein
MSDQVQAAIFDQAAGVSKGTRFAKARREGHGSSASEEWRGIVRNALNLLRVPLREFVRPTMDTLLGHDVGAAVQLDATQAQPDAFVDDLDLSEDADLLGESGEPKRNRIPTGENVFPRMWRARQDSNLRPRD